MKKILVCSVLTLGSIVSIHAQNPATPVNWTTQQFLETAKVNVASLEAKIVTGQPYSAEVQSESIQTLADGNRIVQRSTGRVYRDSQGRVRREEERPSGPPSISIFDPTRGVTVTLDQGRRTARETPSATSIGLTAIRKKTDLPATELARAAAAITKLQEALEDQKRAEADRRKVDILVGSGRATGFLRNPSEEVSEERLPDRMIEGVWATGVRRTTTIAKGAIGNEQPIKTVSEEWTSPDLQILVSTDRNDPRSGRSTYKLLKVGLNEPDPGLFQVPPDYTVQRAGGGGGRGIAPR